MKKLLLLFFMCLPFLNEGAEGGATGEVEPPPLRRRNAMVPGTPPSITQAIDNIRLRLNQNGYIDPEDLQVVDDHQLPTTNLCFEAKNKFGRPLVVPFWKEASAQGNWGAFFQLIGERMVYDELGQASLTLNSKDIERYLFEDPGFIIFNDFNPPQCVRDKLYALAMPFIIQDDDDGELANPQPLGQQTFFQ